MKWFLIEQNCRNLWNSKRNEPAQGLYTTKLKLMIRTSSHVKVPQATLFPMYYDIILKLWNVFCVLGFFSL